MRRNGSRVNLSAMAGVPSDERAQELSADGFHSVRGRLVTVTLVLILTAAIGATLLLTDAARRHRQSTERQLAETARALSLATDGEIGKSEATLRMLSLSPYLQTGDLAAFDRMARLAITDPEMWVVLVDANGMQRINTAAEPGTKLPPSRRPDFDDRWATLLAYGRRVSNLRQGIIRPGPILAVNVLVRRNGVPTYDLALVMRPRVVQRLLERQRLPAGWYGGVIDREGVMIARNINPEGTVGKKATPDMVRRIATTRSGVFESTSLDGAKTLAAYTRSPVTGWTFAVAMPRSEAAGYLNRSLVLLFLACLALFGLGAALTAWLGRDVVRAVDALTEGAERLGRGDLSVRTDTGLRETDAVAVALRSAAIQLKAREDEARRLNETLEVRVEEATSQLVQAQKLEAVGRLTGGVAHDFNNLLTAVIGNLDMLSRKLNDEKLSRYVANARAAAERGAKLTAQLLAFSRKQRLTPEPTDVNAVVGGMSELLASTLGGAVQVEARLDSELPFAVADRTQLELMILNLAINARDAMPHGGAVTIETSRRRWDGGAARPEHPQPGDYVAVTVSDTGTGIPDDVRSHVFEPFFTTKALGRGSGLGLPQVLGVVQQLGGGMDIVSEPGRGTSVVIFLPAAQHASTRPAAQPVGVPVEGAGLGGMQVLVVDDDLDVRSTSAALLRDFGADVLEADGAEAALALVEGGAEPHGALLDYAMPGLTGVELAVRLKMLKPDLAVVLISGYADAEGLVRDWSGPFLQKPYAPEALAGVLARAIAAAKT